MHNSLKNSHPIASPLNFTSFENFCSKINNGVKDHEIIQFIEQLNGRVKYIFSKLKEITNSPIISFDYINAYDNDEMLGFFDPKEFSETISLMGNFADKYSKPFGHSFPTKFLFHEFEEKCSIIYSNFLMEQTIIFDSSCKVPAIISPKEFTYEQMIDDFTYTLHNI